MLQDRRLRSDIAIASRARANALKGLNFANIAIDDINRISNLSATMFSPKTLEVLMKSIQFPPPGLERLQEVSKAITAGVELMSSSAFLNARGLAAIQDTAMNALARIDEINIVAQKMLSGLDMEQYGSALNISAGLSRKLWLTHNNLAISATAATHSLFKGKFKSELQLARIRFLPSMELLSANSLIKSISIESPDVDETEEAEYAVAISTGDSYVNLETLLYRLDIELPSKWMGAKQSLVSDNPERIRHISVSLRKLFEQILESLAPTDEVRNWSDSPDHFNGKVPTRRAQLLFICRGINTESFSDFIKKDIDSMLCAFTLFNKGTHEDMPDIHDMQMRAFMARFESTVRWLLDIRRIS